MLSRRNFLKFSAAMGGGAYLATRLRFLQRAFAQIEGGSLDPANVDKFVLPLVKPPAMPLSKGSNKNKDKYKIAVRQFQQRIISPPHPVTTVWSYGSVDFPGTAVDPVTGALTGGTFNYPAFTVEARWMTDTQVLWMNELVDPVTGLPLQHLLPVDPALHWANPIGRRDTRPNPTLDLNYWNHPYIDQLNDGKYIGPVPMVTHVHGAHTTEDSDGYAEAWWLPASAYTDPNIPYYTGTFYDYFSTKYAHFWAPGTASYKYMNDQPATTLWYHDHTLGMTRLNVYAGPAGYWLIRGGPNDLDLGYVAPGVGDSPLGEYTEIPIVIQDRSFNADGSLFYPDHRAFFEGLTPGDFDPNFPFIFDGEGDGWGYGCDGLVSDVARIWQPEFFGNMMVVNGFTWPYLEVEQRRYRFRFLNGCNSRFLILKADNGMPFYQIGAEQGFLPATVQLNQLLMGPAERADVIMDFTDIPVGTEIILLNLGPDEPFGGGEPGVEFDAADPASTGQVMQFRVKAATSPDTTTPPLDLVLPVATPIGAALQPPRAVSLNEEESKNVNALFDDAAEQWITPVAQQCDNPDAVPFGPTAALLGTLDMNGNGVPMMWADAVTENPALNTTEEWEIHNFTADAHPIHVHLVKFEVVSRTDVDGIVRGPEAWETGPKDTVISYPGEVTNIKMHFDLPGFYVWHCHIVEHEDNEMMRPYVVGPQDPAAPHPHQ